MKFIVAIVFIIVAALVILGIFAFQKIKESNLSKLKRLQESRNLYRDQIDVARKALEIEKDLGNSNAELALMDINFLQREYDMKKELER